MSNIIYASRTRINGYDQEYQEIMPAMFVEGSTAYALNAPNHGYVPSVPIGVRHPYSRETEFCPGDIRGYGSYDFSEYGFLLIFRGKTLLRIVNAGLNL